MTRLHILVEGQTEETITTAMIQPHLESVGWRVSYSILTTKRLASGHAFKGGLSTWAKLRKEILRLVPNYDLVTTVIDYYGLPSDVPGVADRPAGDAYRRVEHVEAAIHSAVGNRRLLPHLVLHETEAWVFAAAQQLSELTGDPSLERDLHRIVASAGGPELIDDGPATAPSKRLLNLMPQCRKTLDGPMAVEALGLVALRDICPHLDAWLSRLEKLADQPANPTHT